MEETLKALTPEQIAKYTRWPYADPTLVKNFLSALDGLTFERATANLAAEAIAHRWGPGTKAAIRNALNEARGQTINVVDEKRGL